jgi:hypothetical protein
MTACAPKLTRLFLPIDASEHRNDARGKNNRNKHYAN